jgi:hypothetical protein
MIRGPVTEAIRGCILEWSRSQRTCHSCQMPNTITGSRLQLVLEAKRVFRNRDITMKSVAVLLLMLGLAISTAGQMIAQTGCP